MTKIEEIMVNVSNSEASYIMNQKGYIVKKEKNVQSSYNICKSCFNILIEKKVLVINDDVESKRKKQDIHTYVLNNDCTLQLGNNILWIIGEEYRDRENKFIASLNPNGKYQMYRTVYSDLSENDKGYEWFVKLFDKNIAKGRLECEIEIDDTQKKKTLKLEIKFPSLSMSKEKEEDSKQSKITITNDALSDYPHNIIIYGAPGTGKSHKIVKDIEDYNLKDLYERVTAHPNYTYSQFFGTYKPISKTNNVGEEFVSYEFVPGPFLRVLIKALSDSQNPYILVIEEINRANPAAIFGDVFQLLDRDMDGRSVYPINVSEEIKKFFEIQESESGKTLLINGEQIAIPSNMYIWATMNSADQGIYPMDSAFKRRWSFEYIGINDNEEELVGKPYEYIYLKNTLGGYTKYAWNTVRKTINEKLRGIVQEDKLLGPFFLSRKELMLSTEDAKKFDNIFKSKVLMYLFEDVLKYKKCDFFVEDVKTLSDVMSCYDSGKIFNFTIEEAPQD